MDFLRLPESYGEGAPVGSTYKAVEVSAPSTLRIYGNASKLVGYATRPDGSLEEVTSVTIPYNSPEGLAGF